MIQSATHDVDAVQRIASIPAILQTVSQMTGLRLTCIARVTHDSWIACAVLDQLGLGLLPHHTLDVDTTLCAKVLSTGKALIVDADSGGTAGTAAVLYGFASYISVPIRRQNGSYFGTLCGIDPLPRQLAGTAALASMTLFAELISQQLNSQQVLEETQVALLDAQATAELREQFIAVLGHDLRNPLGTIITGAELMLLSLGDEKRLTILAKLIQGSGKRMAALVDDVVDLTRGKLGGGIALRMVNEARLCDALSQVVSELRSSYPAREIVLDIVETGTLLCDAARLAQLCSNLLKNALVYGDQARPVGVTVRIRDGALELAVSNHGPAMSDDTIDHLFKPYWRAAAKSPHEGLGLGLFIVGEIARSHGGAMQVTSSADLTTFLFRLACKEQLAA